MSLLREVARQICIDIVNGDYQDTFYGLEDELSRHGVYFDNNTIRQIANIVITDPTGYTIGRTTLFLLAVNHNLPNLVRKFLRYGAGLSIQTRNELETPLIASINSERTAIFNDIMNARNQGMYIDGWTNRDLANFAIDTNKYNLLFLFEPQL